ncbi:Insect cuticle protein [Trinorchestia longiramus]|nr:Insect cuticle protein [Trinorchestia longiramus]
MNIGLWDLHHQRPTRARWESFVSIRTDRALYSSNTSTRTRTSTAAKMASQQNKCSNTMAAAAVALLLVALPVLGRPSPFIDYAGGNSIVSQRGNPGHSVSGSYSWTSPEGTEFFVRYVADEFGYRVVESNALQRSAHGLLADGNQVYRTTDADSEEATDVQQLQELTRETDVSAADGFQEDETSEILTGGLSASSRGRTFEGKGLIPSATQSVDGQEQEAAETLAPVEAAPRSGVPAVETEFTAPVPQEEETSKMEEVVQTMTETMKVDVTEISPQEPESASQTSPAEVQTANIPDEARPFENTEEETIVSALELEATDVMATSDHQADDAALEEEIPAETEATPAQTEETVTFEPSV